RAGRTGGGARSRAPPLDPGQRLARRADRRHFAPRAGVRAVADARTTAPGPRACARHPRLPLAAPARVRGHGRRGRRPHIRHRLNGRGAPVSLTRAPARRTQFLPFAPPVLGEDEIRAVGDRPRSDWSTTGPKNKRFETEFAASLDAPGARAP